MEYNCKTKDLDILMRSTMKHSPCLLCIVVCALIYLALPGRLWAQDQSCQHTASDLFAVKVSQEKAAYYVSILKRNETLVTFIENTLAENDVPRMLRNLCLIESALDKDALSPARAAGLWQFTEAHSKGYGLRKNDRYDVYHSTQVAVKSLRDLYQKYHNWIAVVAAYNCGEGNLDEAMRKARSDKYPAYSRHLPQETVNHVAKFIEACTVTGEVDYLRADYTLSFFRPDSKPETAPGNVSDPALVSTGITAAFNPAIIAEEMNISATQLSQWNPHLEKDLAANGVALLFLPVDSMPDFMLLRNKVLQRSLQIPVTHDRQKL